MKKKPLVIFGVVLVVLIAIIIALPLLIDANQFKPELESRLSSALGRKVQIGNIHLAIFSGGVSVDHVSISDDPAFSSAPFLEAGKLEAGVALIPLIFSKRFEVRSFNIVDPEVSLLRSRSGMWNFSSLGAGSNAASKGANPAGAPDFSVQKLALSNGKVTVGTAGTGGKTQIYEGVNIEALNLSYTSEFPFQIAAKTPGGGTVMLSGTAGPMDAANVALTPLHAKIDVEHLDLATTGFVDPSAGLAGEIGFTGELSSDHGQMTSKGTLQAEKIRLSSAGTPSRVPVKIDYDTSYDMQRETGILRDGDVHIGKAVARLGGTYNTAGASTTVEMKLDGKGMPVTDLEGVLPAVGVTLPSGASLQSGMLGTDLVFSGPVDKLTIAGPVALSNAKLAGFSLKGNLAALATFAGIKTGDSNDTEIQTLSANLRVDTAGTHATNLDMVVPALGTLTGNGDINPSGQLNCKMIAKITSSNGGIGLAASALSSLTGGTAAGTGIPFTIRGTTSKPIFVPDVAGIAGAMLKNRAGTSGNAASTAAGILGGLLGKKKTH